MEALSPFLDADLYGGKASGLVALMSFGFKVPPGFAIDPNEPLDEGRLWTAVGRWIGGVDTKGGSVKLAVRSSSTFEDGDEASHAGEFSTVIGDFSCRELVAAIGSVRSSGTSDTGSIPTIIQRAIEPVIAGVAFSCDPITFERSRVVISWVEGMADGLVGGDESGITITVDPSDSADPQWPVDPEILESLTASLITIQGHVGRPVDVEWAVDSDGELWLLQARPIVLPLAQVVDGLSASELNGLPPLLKSHPKMRLRLTAALRGVLMSKASVVVANGIGPKEVPGDFAPTRDAAGVSVVLLYPSHIQQEVQREFAQVDRTDVPLFTLGCRRYFIRRYPVLEKTQAVVSEVTARGLSSSWLVSTVAQEIYDAEATGIVRKIGKEIVVEVARGHFVPKGVVDPSRLVLSESGEVLDYRRVEQNIVFHFINGFVVTEEPVERQIDLSDSQIALAVMQVVPLLEDYPNAALEFGVLKHRNLVTGYVIDIAEADDHERAETLTRELIGSGVLSVGKSRGVAVRATNRGEADLDRHLLSILEAESESLLDNVVVFADRASVDLLPFVARCGTNCAFVFRNASLLAHLSVVLREREIPAVIVEDDLLWEEVSEGAVVTVDAITDGLTSDLRLKWEA
jgi:rifampicin phosphotransferase